MIKYPRPIKNNDTIGVTATSSGVVESEDILRLDLAISNLKDLGFTIKETKNVRTNKKFVSSSPKTRAKEFLDLYQDANISLIAQVRGGEFLMEMLAFLDKNILKRTEPKWLTGYSDSSLLNFYLTTNFNIATVTSMNIFKFGMKKLDASLLLHLDVLKSNEKIIQNNFKYYEEERNLDNSFNLTKKVIYKSLYKEENITIKGRLIGGCIEAIATIIGTKYDNTTKFISEFPEGMLWYLEDFMANPLDLYRLLWQMKEAGWFQNANGFLIGRTRALKEIEDFTYLDALHKVFDDMKVPVIYDVDIGHLMPTITIINGSLGTFNYKNHQGTLIMEKK